MGYSVRVLTPSETIIAFSEIQEQVNTIRLMKGMDNDWEQIEVQDSAENELALLERMGVSPEKPGEGELAMLKDRIRGFYPASAREWVRNYLEKVKTIYVFRLNTDNITTDDDWRILGRVQNHLKDSLTGIIQADNEGYYNETGEYILWQMYPGAGGTIPAATLDEKGEWITFQLNLDDDRAVARFKSGEIPRRGLLDIFFKKK